MEHDDNVVIWILDTHRGSDTVYWLRVEQYRPEHKVLLSHRPFYATYREARDAATELKRTRFPGAGIEDLITLPVVKPGEPYLPLR
ncbi:MAG: hypothetical protein WD757_00605 [Actinomycetota bacterium]